MYRLEIWHEIGGWHVHSGPAIDFNMAKSLLEYQKRFNHTRARIVRVLDGKVIEETQP